MKAAKNAPLADVSSRALRESGTYPISREHDANVHDTNQHDTNQHDASSDPTEDPLLAIVAHDLRGPLGAVLASARVLADRENLSGPARRGVDRVLRSGERMRRLVDQLLTVGRARQPGGIPVRRASTRDLRPLVTRIVDEVRASHPDRWIVQPDEGPVFAQFDEDRMEQVVSNLLENAVIHGDPERPIVIWVAAEETVATLSVHNHGDPIPPELVGLLFDPFQRARSERRGASGLGLGLYIAERIVSAHDGCLSVTSDDEAGTRFVAKFPRWSPRRAKP